MNKGIVTIIELPAGKYWVGDPGYTISDDHWNVIDFPYTDLSVLLIPDTPYSFIMLSTSFGDGIFEDNMGRHYAVDSGHLGIIPFEYAPDKEEKKRIRYIYESDEPFRVYRELNLTEYDRQLNMNFKYYNIVFGEVVIEA